MNTVSLIAALGQADLRVLEKISMPLTLVGNCWAAVTIQPGKRARLGCTNQNAQIHGCQEGPANPLEFVSTCVLRLIAGQD